VPRSLLELEDAYDHTASIDPQEYLAAALRWHFSEETGSPLWLELAATLDFDPVSDIRSFDDLGRFPDIARHLRERPVAELIPQGLAEEPAPFVFETGGTTGVPKRLVYTDRWVRRALSWKTAELREAGFPSGAPWLVAMPSGPHAFGHTTRLQARELGSVLHTVDLDPRWVKKLIAAGRPADGYVAHVIEQIGHVVRTQRIGALTTTPPVLTELLLDEELTGLLRESLGYLALAGAHLDDDTFDLITDAFPDAVVQNIFGSTMVLTTTRLRVPNAPAPEAVYDGYTPFVLFWVLDPDTGERVGRGERGQVRMSHLSSGVFIPNNLERDSAIRVDAPEGAVGDSLSSPSPLDAFEGEQVIQGVY
jgi:acyl-CoA synthetase (AMP-forming)/AMP-acid ligase II